MLDFILYSYIIIELIRE